MNNNLLELKRERAQLQARIEEQREQIAEIGTHWRTVLALADDGMSAVRFIRVHPVLSAGVATFFAVRYRGLSGLARGVWRVWNGYRYFTWFAGKLTSHK